LGVVFAFSEARGAGDVAVVLALEGLDLLDDPQPAASASAQQAIRPRVALFIARGSFLFDLPTQTIAHRPERGHRCADQA
jgi:hypothetical protein